MPTWGQVLRELNDTRKAGIDPPFDHVRRKYLTALNAHTGRDTILLASGWTSSRPDLPGWAFSISDQDLSGFMEAVHGLQGTGLDLIIHSPGGDPHAAEAIISYLRTKYADDIRVIIPQFAMSAAAMIACGANRIVMGKHSFVGPIDPQLVLQTPLGPRLVPAHAIMSQFKQAQRDCVDQTKLAAWLPMLAQYGPDLLEQCRLVSEFSQSIVERWLGQYMFAGKADAATLATAAAKWLADHEEFKTHSRHIPRSELEKRQISIEHLEADQTLQDLVLSIFHATQHTFAGRGVTKIVENHLGKAYVWQMNVMQAQVPSAPTIPAGVLKQVKAPGFKELILQILRKLFGL